MSIFISIPSFTARRSRSGIVLATSLLLLTSLPYVSAAPFYSPMINVGGAGPSYQASFQPPTTPDTPTTPSFSDHQAMALQAMQLQPVAFAHCGTGNVMEGQVKSARFGPCVGGSGEDGSPCELQTGKEYTLELTYSVSSATRSSLESPRAAIGAQYSEVSSGPYPGQSFSACEYTACPLSQDSSVDQIFTIPLHGFPQSLDRIIVNVTSSIREETPVFCASIPVHSVPARPAAASIKKRRAVPFGGMGARTF